MCFSAEASFTAAVVVGAIGYCTLKSVRSPRALPLGLLPVLFGFHQACEGVLWIFLNNGIQPNWFFDLAKFLYVLVGFIAWPTFFSFSALMLEEVPWRRSCLKACLCFGVLVSLFFAWRFASNGIDPTIVGNSVHYDNTHRPEGLSYLAILSLPFLLSSVRYLWILGAAAPISFALSAYFYWANFASIWCFFAAFLSCWIYIVIKNLPDQPSLDRQSS